MNRFEMNESDHVKEEYKLYELNKGKFDEVQSMKSLVVLLKRNKNGAMKDAFVIHIKDKYLSC